MAIPLQVNFLGGAAAFDDLTSRLRATEEWQCVERGVEIRLRRD